MSNNHICSECGEDQSQFDHAFFHCHDCGECVIFNPQKDGEEFQCILCCKCADGQTLKSHPGWVCERVSRAEYSDPYAFIKDINYGKELFEFIKARVDPNAKAVLERKFYQNRVPNRKLKASIIICPKPNCNYHCIEDRDPLIDHFLRHMKKAHHITPKAEFVENLKEKISYLRNNNRLSYTNPFIHIQLEDLLT